MKNTILGLFLALVLIVGTSATTVSIMTIKPALPKSTVVFSTEYGVDDCVRNIKTYLNKGYAVKSVAGTTIYGSTWIVVMEKY